MGFAILKPAKQCITRLCVCVSQFQLTSNGKLILVFGLYIVGGHAYFETHRTIVQFSSIAN